MSLAAFGLEDVLASYGLEHVGLALTLAAFAYHSRKVSKAGSILGGALGTAALFSVFMALLIGLGVFEPDLARAGELAGTAYEYVSWALKRWA